MIDDAEQSDLLETLNQIGIALSSERKLNKLLDRIVRESMNITFAEGGSLYIVEDDHLRFSVIQNDQLDEDLRAPSARHNENNQLPLNTDSISGYVAVTGEIVEIPDAYNLPEDAPYSFDPTFDEKHGYRTRSLLGIPLDVQDGNILGVLLLVNARDPQGNVSRFSDEKIQLLQSLASQAGVAIRNAQLNKEIKDAYLESIQRLSIAAEYKDPDTAEHIHRMSLYSKRLTEEMDWEEDRAEQMLYASSMHDVGKIGVPDRILLKPDSLSEEEYDEIKKHTRIGYRILSGSEHEVMQLSARIALTHHEKWNGTGYPRGLEGDNIPIEGRVVAIADVFDALTSARPYKEAFPVDQSLEIIREERGAHFDPALVDVFMDCLDDLLDIREANTDSTENQGENT